MKTLLMLPLALLGLSSLAMAATPQEEANKKLVVEFYERVLGKGDADAATQYIGSTYIQHNPWVPNGVEALQSFVRESRKANPKASAEVKRAIAEGDLVVLHVHSKRNPEDRGMAIVDIFRVKDGKIIEHWDVIQPVPEKAANTNTMF